MRKRYYIHGDEDENRTDRFYCAYCDLLVDEDHFKNTPHPGTDKEKYDRSLKSWKAIEKISKNGVYQRLDGARNLFSKIPEPEKPKIGTFYRWLKKQSKRDDPIGDLSVDVLRDRTFPMGTNSLVTMRKHLINKSSCDEAIQALEEAYEEFKTKNPMRTGLPPSVRFEVFRRDGYRCQICGANAVNTRLEVDHKHPVSKGGSDEMSNLWTLCFDCNRGKGAKTL